MWCQRFIVGLVITISVLDLACGRWCTRLVKKHHVETDFVMVQCTQSYKARCGWFSSEMCTYYEQVECPVQNNRTVERYYIVEECCPGYMLDPINNITCIKENIGSLHDSSDDSTIFGLSHGAYAGIVCTLLFFSCVIILVAWHIFKRKRNAKLKENKSEMCVTAKMIPLQT